MGANLCNICTRKQGVVEPQKMGDREFADDMLKAHNRYRKLHQAESLTLSGELSAHAQKWADHLASTGQFQHSEALLNGERLGENIAMKWSSEPGAYTGQEATDQWYSEIHMYKFGGEPKNLDAGHFTQVVWKGSKELGVGKAVASDGKVIVVANYRPAGNLLNTFALNVLPSKDGKIPVPVLPASDGRGGPGGESFTQRFQDMCPEFKGADQSQGHSQSNRDGKARGGESKTVRTFTTTEGTGPNKVTKTVVEETITTADGQTIVNRKETTSHGADTPVDHSQESSVDHGKVYPATRPPADSTQPQKAVKFANDCLKAHNAKRALHGAPALSLASDLSDHAQKWAEHLVKAEKFEHSKCMLNGQRIGENIATKWSSPSPADYTGQQAVNQWYDEIKDHDYKSNHPGASGHFTQVVWKGSQQLGVGKAQKDGRVIVVCNYRPPGNMIGDYTKNVLHPHKRA